MFKSKHALSVLALVIGWFLLGFRKKRLASTNSTWITFAARFELLSHLETSTDYKLQAFQELREDGTGFKKRRQRRNLYIAAWI